MKALVIPDVHLKPYMFKEAAEWMRKGVADRAVCLMDIPDDWNREYDIELYAQTFDAAISFAKEFPDTLLISILLGQTSTIAESTSGLCLIT